MQLQTKAFPAAGIYVMRSERIYLMAICHPIGVNRHGPHKHNDWLSFELCVDGEPVIIDPGTYCYTGNMEMRRLFRSTAYHNTVVVDGAEQIPILDSVFGLNNPQGEVQILTCESSKERDLLETEHTGYARLNNPVIHRRRFLLDKQKHEVEISDSFSGEGAYFLEWYVHLEAGLTCNTEDRNVVISTKDKPIMRLTFFGWDMKPEIKKGWISKAYNQREEAELIFLNFQGELSSSLYFIQRFDPFDDQKR